MPDHNRVGRPTSVLAASFAIGGCSLAISAWALEPAENGSAVVYRTNDLGMQFVSVRGAQFPMGCPEGTKPGECSADEKPVTHRTNHKSFRNRQDGSDAKAMAIGDGLGSQSL
jgi:formylglycine-generating enzyme required for sulfatase activity